MTYFPSAHITEGRKEALYLRALETYGPRAQCDQCIEECAELTVAIRHRSMGRAANVCEEIADVLIMAGQMRLLFGADEVDRIMGEKLARLEGRMEKVKA